MAVRYVIDLTDAERAALREILSQNQVKRSTLINAYILLKADRSCGWTNADIASAYDVSTKKVEQLKKRFVEEGFEAALYRKPVTNAHRRKITGDEEAHLIALCLRLSRFMVYCASHHRRHHPWRMYSSRTSRTAPRSSWM